MITKAKEVIEFCDAGARSKYLAFLERIRAFSALASLG